MTLPLSRNTTYAPGDKVKSTDLNDLQDKVIDLSAARSIWVHPSAFYFQGGTVTFATAGQFFAAQWTSIASSPVAMLAVPAQFFSSTVGQKLTGIDLKVKQAGATGMTFSLVEVDNMGTTLDPIDGASSLGTGVGTATGPASTGIKTISLSSLSKYQKPDVMLYVSVTPATANDVLYGVKFTFENAA